MIVQARGGQTDQTGPASANGRRCSFLAGQCGFAGCSSTTLVVFTFRSSGANTMTQTVLAWLPARRFLGATCSVSPRRGPPGGLVIEPALIPAWRRPEQWSK